jgi:hypothetical protein
MSLTFPRLRGNGQHRASSTDLRDENRLLLAREIAAADFFALLMRDRATAEHLADEYAQQLAAQETELRALRAFKANACAVDQPAGERDIDPDDQPTQPVDVRPLWQALGQGVA